MVLVGHAAAVAVDLARGGCRQPLWLLMLLLVLQQQQYRQMMP